MGLEELRGHGRVAYVEALRSYDPSRGIPFSTYAYPRVRGAIYEGVASDAHGRPRRRDGSYVTSEEHERNVTDVFYLGREVESPEALAIELDEAERVREEIERLPARERMLVKRHDLDGVELAAVSVEMGMSRTRATRVRARGLEMLRERCGWLRP